MKLLLTCEHASNKCPAHLVRIFLQHEKIRLSHRGWDEGALEIALSLKKI